MFLKKIDQFKCSAKLCLLSQIIFVKSSLWSLSFVINFKQASWDSSLVRGLDFLANSVLQVPFFLMTLMRYITPTLDHMFKTPISRVLSTSSCDQVHGFSPVGRSNVCSKA